MASLIRTMVRPVGGTGVLVLRYWCYANVQSNTGTSQSNLNSQRNAAALIFEGSKDYTLWHGGADSPRW